MLLESSSVAGIVDVLPVIVIFLPAEDEDALSDPLMSKCLVYLVLEGIIYILFLIDYFFIILAKSILILMY